MLKSSIISCQKKLDGILELRYDSFLKFTTMSVFIDEIAFIILERFFVDFLDN